MIYHFRPIVTKVCNPVTGNMLSVWVLQKLQKRGLQKLFCRGGIKRISTGFYSYFCNYCNYCNNYLRISYLGGYKRVTNGLQTVTNAGQQVTT